MAAKRVAPWDLKNAPEVEMVGGGDFGLILPVAQKKLRSVPQGISLVAITVGTFCADKYDALPSGIFEDSRIPTTPSATSAFATVRFWVVLEASSKEIISILRPS